LRLIALIIFASIASLAADVRIEKLPLYFESHGDSYVSHGAGFTLRVSPGGTVLAVGGGTLRMRMVGSSAPSRLEALDPLPGHVAYFSENGAGETFGTYGKVLSRSVYPGIDLVLYGNQNRMEYDFRVAAGSRAEQIALAFDVASDGSERPEIDADGDLVVHVGASAIRQPKPVAYQTVNGSRRDVAARYRIDKAGHVRFCLGPYDSNRDLVVDPTLLFDHHFGPAYSSASAVALDAQGNIYVAGQTTGVPLPAGLVGDSFVSKWSAEGTQLIYSAHFGGTNGNDQVSGIAVDSNGSVYLTGATGSPNFTVTANAFQKNLVGNRNAFVAKLSPDGTRLVYSSFLGGGFEQSGGIAVDDSGAAYVTGTTYMNFPVTANAFQPTPGANCTYTPQWFNYPMTGDAFVTKISPEGSLVYSSYLGGGCGEYGYGITVNADGTVWVGGATFSPNFPVTQDALQPVYGGGFGDGFLVKVAAQGDSLVYATFLGGIDYDTINAIATDSAGNLYLTGASNGFSQPASPRAFQPKPDGFCVSFNLGPPTFNIDGNAFVMKLNSSATQITSLSYLGSPCFASGSAIAVDSTDAPWIVGYGGPSFPMASPLELRAAGGGFVSKFSPDLTQLLFSTSFDQVNGLAVDADGMAYVAGAANPPGVTGTGSNVSTEAYIAEINAAPIAVSIDNVLSAGSFANLTPGESAALAPGKVIRVSGRGIGPGARTQGTIKGGVITNKVAGVQVTFDGVAAPLLYVSSTEIGCIVPYSIAGRSMTTLQVTYNGAASNAVPIPLQVSAPDVLEVLNGDFSVNSESNPAPANSIVTMYLTGAGQTVPASSDGEIYASPLPLPVATITIADLLPVTFAAAAYGLADGILQVNFQAPAAQPGELGSPLTLSTGTASADFVVYVK
jgi:uncharacterized protein (TIGR03437 family)